MKKEQHTAASEGLFGALRGHAGQAEQALASIRPLVDAGFARLQEQIQAAGAVQMKALDVVAPVLERSTQSALGALKAQQGQLEAFFQVAAKQAPKEVDGMVRPALEASRLAASFHTEAAAAFFAMANASFGTARAGLESACDVANKMTQDARKEVARAFDLGRSAA